MKKKLRTFTMSILLLSLLVVPVFAKTYIVSNQTNNEIVEGSILKVGEKIKFEGEIESEFENSTSKITFNYFKEDSTKARSEVNCEVDECDRSYTSTEKYPTITIKSIEETGLVIPNSKTVNGKEVKFLGWEVAYVKLVAYNNYYSTINLVPKYGIEHEIIKNPTQEDATFSVTNANRVDDYYFASFTKKEGLTPRIFISGDNPFTSEVNSSLDESSSMGFWDSLTSNQAVLKAYDSSLITTALYGYFSVDSKSDSRSIKIESGLYELGDNWVSIKIFNVNEAADPDYTAYELALENGYVPESSRESMSKYKTTKPIYEGEIYSHDYAENIEIINSSSQDGIFYESEYKIDLTNLEDGLYKIYIDATNSYDSYSYLENYFDFSKCDTTFTFENIDLFSMDDFEWLNKDNSMDSSSNTITNIEIGKSYLAMAKYDDEYTLTSKAFTAKKSSVIEEVKDKIEEKVEEITSTPKAGDNICIYLVILLFAVIILVRKLKRRGV